MCCKWLIMKLTTEVKIYIFSLEKCKMALHDLLPGKFYSIASLAFAPTKGLWFYCTTYRPIPWSLSRFLVKVDEIYNQMASACTASQFHSTTLSFQMIPPSDTAFHSSPNRFFYHSGPWACRSSCTRCHNVHMQAELQWLRVLNL